MSSLPYRPEFAGERPYGAPQLDVPVRLNVNENPYPPSPELVAEIERRVGQAARSLNRYPDRDATALREDLATYLAGESGVSLPPSNVWAANGSNEVMLQILTAFAGPGRAVVSFLPTYSMYPEYARDTSSRWVTGRRREDFALDASGVEEVMRRERPAVLLLASPNNPTGTALPFSQLREILRVSRGTGPEEGMASLVVVDEAYAEFRRSGVPSALELLAGNPHLVVTRTMSKAFGAAGLRLGYMAAGRDVVDQVMVARLPYHLSALTQAAARAALAHREALARQVAAIRDERDGLVSRLRGLGLDVTDSDANFVLFGAFADRHAVWRALLERGVLVREIGPEGHLRVSVGTPGENAAFLAALQEAM